MTFYRQMIPSLSALLKSGEMLAASIYSTQLLNESMVFQRKSTLDKSLSTIK